MPPTNDSSLYAAPDATTTRSILNQWEQDAAFQCYGWTTSYQETNRNNDKLGGVLQLATYISNGNYACCLSKDNNNHLARLLFYMDKEDNDSDGDEKETIIDDDEILFVKDILQSRVESLLDEDSLSGDDEDYDVAVDVTFFMLELVAIAALNLFLQVNYTGPTMTTNDSGIKSNIHPHPVTIRKIFELREMRNNNHKNSSESAVSASSRPLQTAILTEMAVEGEWPCPVCKEPYFLLVARAILKQLVQHQHKHKNDDHHLSFKGVHLWHARAAVAHLRLLQYKVGEAPVTLAHEVDEAFGLCIRLFGNHDQQRLAAIWLEWGLADHHLDRPQRGKPHFQKARQCSGLTVEVTGAMGKRTKFQQQDKAQLLVRATSATPVSNTNQGAVSAAAPGHTVQAVKHAEDGILLERIKYRDEKENSVTSLNFLDQCIVLALCLDVKNSNAGASQDDALTAEEMGAFLARVLDEASVANVDWMIYSTALLERAWLEFERSHTKERAILQMQALADQQLNSDKLTLTQSTQECAENSAPVQDRLRNLHTIVYPPQWNMFQQMADRYASMGMVTSAAELYTEIELWDEVVDCYSRSGKRNLAESLVRRRLEEQPTPRMWTALGDLTGDPSCYEKAIALSGRRYAKAFICLAQYCFEHADGKSDNLKAAMEYYEQALRIRPLQPKIWFKCGTLAMQLKDWPAALGAFSQVVQQKPEEAEAWANVAAVHLHNRNPEEAYPALAESLKYNRNNWRVWTTQLYTCLDLEKYNQAIQAANAILDLRLGKAQSEGVPLLEEKCVRAIVGGTTRQYTEIMQEQQRQCGSRGSASEGDEKSKTGARNIIAGQLESARRTLLRVHVLLDRIGSSGETTTTMSWVYECLAFLHSQMGADDKVLDYLMQEYRAILAVPEWERDQELRSKLCHTIAHVTTLRKLEGSKSSLIKLRILIRNVNKKIENSLPDSQSKDLPELEKLQNLLNQIEQLLSEL